MTLVNAETGEIETTGNYEIHPAATLFPLIEGEAFRGLIEDIRTHGQAVPVVLDQDGRLLDGRNRARACAALGIDVKESRYSGDDPLGFVISHNMHRRHLSESQRAMVAAKLANLRGAGRPIASIEAIDESSITEADAARMLNVGRSSVQRARIVHDHGSPETIKQVESGAITVSRAAEAIKESRTPTPPEPTSKVTRGLPAAERAEQIAALATKGSTSTQIARELGITEQQVRKLARQHDVSIPADVVRGRVHRVDHMRILDNVTEATEVAVMSLRDIDVTQLDREEALERVDSLTASINALSKAVKKIKESFYD